jgi:hypothetical protein
MSISRTGDCPIYLDYVTRMALIPRAGSPSPEFLQMVQFNFRWIDIPCYQRGLVWDEEDFEALLNSDSVFLGNAILGEFDVPDPRNASFSKLPDSATKYEVLVDGLQRFSIGTALLHILHRFILSDGARFPNEKQYYASLSVMAKQWAPVYEHNHTELQGHSRKAVSESYLDFQQALANWIENEINRGRGKELADRLQLLLLRRQIAPDTYHGFKSEYQVTSTFIGLNTIRVELSIVDWLRSVIVDKGAPKGSAIGWDDATISEIDNRFTEVFVYKSNPVQELMPFAAIILDCLTKPTSSTPINAIKVFPSWNSGLSADEVRRFLDFVETLRDFKNTSKNPYFYEIYRCGKIPFAGLICYYYRQYLSNGNQKPSFITGGKNEDSELHAYLRANYRILLAGRIGRTRDFSAKLLTDNISLRDIADEISLFGVDCKLGSMVDPDWLRTILADSDKTRAQRVFNMCLLPNASVAGGPFQPLVFGKKGNTYQTDHMIPESEIDNNVNQPGEAEGRTLRNFVAIRRTANNGQSNLSCSAKMSATGSYANECANDVNVHPYTKWLVTNQSKYGSHLDEMDRLQANSTPRMVEERIKWFVDALLSKL